MSTASESVTFPNAVLPSNERTHARAGLVYALGAYLAWGVIPSFFKLLAHVPPLVVLSHRVVWSVVFLSLLLSLQRKWNEVRAAILNRRTLLMLICSTTFIAINWYTFIWAVTNGRVLQASMGYFINPLVNVLLGVVILGERLRPWQIAGLLLATAGVVVLTLTTGGVPWVALSLAFSFSFYGLLRKVAAVGPLAGLSVETAILFPAAVTIAAGWAPKLGPPPSALMAHSHGTYGLLIASGVVTAIPLLLFAAGAKRLRLSTLGFMQYVAPTLQFLLAVLVYREPFDSRQILSFALIWAGLAAYTLESILNFRDSRPATNAAQFPVAVPE